MPAAPTLLIKKPDKKRLKAEMWDKVQYIFRNYYDRMMHAVIYYDGTADEHVFARALRAVIEKVPVLRSRFVNNPVAPYWKITARFDDKDFFSLVYADDADTAATEFITSEIKAGAKLQIKARLIRCGGRDTVCLLINHMCFDGGDLKYFIRKLAEAYNNIKNNTGVPLKIKIGERGSRQMYSGFNKVDRVVAKALYKNVSAVKSKTAFPFTCPNNDYKMILTHKIRSDVFAAVKSKGKEMGATINDIVLAAYVRSIYALCGLGEAQPLSVPCMIDLRRHIKEGATLGLTNMTGFIVCRLDGAGEDIFETVERVKAALSIVKSDKFIGLYGIPLLSLAFRILPFAFSELAIKSGYENPLLGMSNIGIIDDKALELGGLKPRDAFLTGAIKYKPYIQLALTTFKDEITFSCAVKANDADKRSIEKMFGVIERELRAFVRND